MFCSPILWSRFQVSPCLNNRVNLIVPTDNNNNIVGSEEGRMYADLTTTTDVESLFPENPRLNVNEYREITSKKFWTRKYQVKVMQEC